MLSQRKIVEQLYDVILGGEEWSAPLNQIADFCGMENAALVVVDNRLAYASVIAPRANPEVIAAYNNKWWECDPTVKTTSSTPVGQLTSLADTGHEKFLRSTFYREFWSHSGLGAERIATNLVLSDSAFVSCVLQAPVRHDEIDTTTFQRFATFVPHLVRATTIQRKLQRLALANTFLGATEGADPVATMIVGADGWLIFTDDSGERILTPQSGMRLRRGYVELSEHNAHMHLMRAVSAASGAYSDLPVYGPVCVMQGDKKLVINVMPFVPALHPIGLFTRRPAAMLRIREVTQTTQTSPERRNSLERRKETTTPVVTTQRESRFAAIKQDIRQNLANSKLSLTWLARRHKMTPRAIRNLFYAEDTNFTDWLLNTRLDLAKDMLTDPRHAHTNIVMIALDAGFGDLSWFHLAFRRRFGVTPALLRAKG